MSWLRTLYDPLIKAGYQDQYNKWQALVNAGLSEAPVLDVSGCLSLFSFRLRGWGEDEKKEDERRGRFGPFSFSLFFIALGRAD